MTDAQGDPTPKTSETDPPAANQKGDEPIPTTPDESAQSGAPDDDNDDAGAAAMTEGSSSGGSSATHAAGGTATETGGIPAPGDAQGVAVPAVQAAAGTSEESAPVDGVRIPANAPPGKPDGEVDTRS